jgi:tartrate dehydratase alpha subunit/fumarate hydratase class I-like protein
MVKLLASIAGKLFDLSGNARRAHQHGAEKAMTEHGRGCLGMTGRTMLSGVKFECAQRWACIHDAALGIPRCFMASTRRGQR